MPGTVRRRAPRRCAARTTSRTTAPGRPRHGDDHLPYPMRCDDVGHISQRPEHRKAAEKPESLQGVVVGESNQAPAELGIAQDLAGDHVARGPRADDQRRPVSQPVGSGRFAAAEQLGQRAGKTDRCQRDERVQDQDGDGNAGGGRAEGGQQHAADDEARDARHDRSAENGKKILGAGAGPEPVVESDPEEESELQGDGHGGERKQRGRVGAGPPETLEADEVTQPRSHQKRDGVPAEDVPVSNDYWHGYASCRAERSFRHDHRDGAGFPAQQLRFAEGQILRPSLRGIAGKPR